MFISLLPAFLALPREGHIEAAYDMFGYFKVHQQQNIAFDPSYPEVGKTLDEFYRGATEMRGKRESELL